MVDGSRIVDVIDELLAADKQLIGAVAWQPTQRPDEMRASWPLLIGDESPTGVSLVIDYYPEGSPARYHISLNAPKSVFRVDYDEGAIHTNSFNAPKELAGKVVSGPHYHPWLDNRHFCAAQSLPDALLNARPLPANPHGFQNVVRWFLGQV